MALPPLTPNAWLRWDLIRRRLPDRASVLEIGMGQGAVGCRLSSLGPYTGVELDATSRAVAIERLPSSARVLPELEALPAGEQFDLVCAFEVLEHVEDEAGALSAWTSHLRPGGMVLLSVPAHAQRFGAADEVVGHFRRYDKQPLIDLLVATGLDGVQVEAVGFPLGFLLEAGRNAVAARRRPADTIEDRTATSGRFLQPSAALGPLTRAATSPFRLAQRPFRHTEVATGWLARAHRPRA